MAEIEVCPKCGKRKTLVVLGVTEHSKLVDDQGTIRDFKLKHIQCKNCLNMTAVEA